MTDTYEWGQSFQRRVLSLLAQNPGFLKGYRDVIKPQYFDYDPLKSICRLVVAYWDRLDELPSKATLQEELADFCRKHNVSDVLRTKLLDEIDAVYSEYISDPAGITDKVVRFGQRQALKGSVLEIIAMLDKDGGLDPARDLINDALAVGYNANKLGTSVVPNLLTLPQRLQQEEKEKPRVPTFIPTLDRVTKNGMKVGEVWYILSPPSGGKSAWLTFISGSAIRQGHSVAYASLGDLQEEDIELRAAARLTNLDQAVVARGEPEYMRKAKKISQFTWNWQVKYWPSESASVADIRAWLMRLAALKGIHPRLLVVDYVDELKPEHDNTYRSLGKIYSQLSQIANDFNLVVWTGSQVQRGYSKGPEDVIRMDESADSWMKAWKADGVISWNQTQEEYHAGEGRIWIDKVRRGRRQILVPCVVDFGMMHFKEKPPEEAQAA